MNDASWVTVTAYPAREAAHTAQRALDTAGIDAEVDQPDERRVRVRVENLDALRAGDVLTRECATLPEIDEPDEEAIENACPACDSLDVASSHRWQTFLLLGTLVMAVGVAADLTQAAFFGVLAAAVYQLVRGRWRCTSCGSTWD
jgi:hypothetical protein